MTTSYKYTAKNFLLLLLFLISVSVLILKLWDYALICMKDGMSVRETAELLLIQNIQQGNLQSPAYFPDNLYLYGILKAAILAFIPFGPHTIILNRAFSVLCLMAACGVMWGSIYHITKSRQKTLHWVIIFFILTIYFSTFTQHTYKPDALGFLLSNIILYLSLKNKTINIIFFPILLVGTYMTKQYFLHSFVYVISGYIILNTQKHRFSQALFVCFATAIGIGLLFLLPQTRYAFHHHLTMRSNAEFKYMIRGWFVYIWHMMPIFILLIPPFIIRLKNLQNSNKTLFASIYRKLSNNRILTYIITNLILHSIIMMRIAQHTGAPQIQYFSHIYSSIFLLFAAYIISEEAINTSSIVTVSVFLTSSILKNRMDFSLPKKPLTEEYLQLAEEFAQKGDKVRGCASTAWIELRSRGRVDDNGQLYYLPTVYPDNGGFGLTPFKEKAEEYKNSLIDKIKNKEYEVVYVDRPAPCYSFISRKDILPILEANYTKEREIRITPSSEPISRYVRK